MQLGKMNKGAAAVVPPVTAETEPPVVEKPGRALVAAAPVVETAGCGASHRDALFLAQLIAVKNRHPQSRERRRAEPGEATAAYRATAALVP
jgi:hypothetical protein